MGYERDPCYPDRGGDESKEWFEIRESKIRSCVWIFFGMWKFMLGSRWWKVGVKKLHLEPQCGVSLWMIRLKWEDFC